MASREPLESFLEDWNNLNGFLWLYHGTEALGKASVTRQLFVDRHHDVMVWSSTGCIQDTFGRWVSAETEPDKTAGARWWLTADGDVYGGQLQTQVIHQGRPDHKHQGRLDHKCWCELGAWAHGFTSVCVTCH